MNGGIIGSNLDWKFSGESNKTCQGRASGTCSMPRGKMLGGTSGLNGMIYNRGNKNDYDKWSELGNDGWDYENVLKYFKKAEGNQHDPFVQYENGKYHSADGPLKIDFFGRDRMGQYRKMFIDAAAQAGYPTIRDINANTYVGYLEMQGTYFNGRRQSSAKAYLAPAKNRTNLHVIKHAFVEKILINSNNEAYGVEFVYNETNRLTATARKEVVLCAGTYMSPVLLMLSGVGPKDVLENLNISVKADLPVGKNLADHTATNLWFKFNPSEEETAAQQLDDIYEFAAHNKGPLTSIGVTAAYGFLSTLNHTFPDHQIYIFHYKKNSPKLKGYVGSYKKEFGDALVKENENHDVAYIAVSLAHPKSRGYVTLASASASDKPIIVPQYFTDQDDVETTVRAIKQQISFTKSPAYKKNGGEFIHIPVEECDRFEFQSDDYFRCYIKYFGNGNSHPVSTSKMGPDTDAEAVVDSRLRVRNIKNLRQADAGV